MLTNWILAFLGIAIYFLARYANKKNTKGFSFGFWIKDNWPETLVSILGTIALMLVFTSDDPETIKFIDKWLGWLPIQFKALGAGLFNIAWVYAVFKTKSK